MNALKRWWDEEPIATRLGPVVALIAGYLVYRGVIDTQTQELVVGIVAILFGGAGVAAARSKVFAAAKLPGMVLDFLHGHRGDLPGSESD